MRWNVKITNWFNLSPLRSINSQWEFSRPVVIRIFPLAWHISGNRADWVFMTSAKFKMSRSTVLGLSSTSLFRTFYTYSLNTITVFNTRVLDAAHKTNSDQGTLWWRNVSPGAHCQSLMSLWQIWSSRTSQRRVDFWIYSRWFLF